VVDVKDYTTARQKLGTTLPPITAAQIEGVRLG
jgi:hypothetical protein